MAAVFKGAISFGLISIPIKLHSASESKGTGFRMLHKDCITPISQKRWCNQCEKEVEYKDIIKGYESAKNEFVVISESELKGLEAAASQYIEILDFVSLDEVDPVYFNKPYFLSPETAGEKAYILLYLAMEKLNAAAIAKTVMRQKEHICVIRTYQNSLQLSTMHYAADIRVPSVSVDNLQKKTAIKKEELDLACQLVKNLQGSFDINNYADTFSIRLMQMIQDKVQGESIHVPQKTQKPTAKSLDLFERLKQSVEQTQSKKPAKSAGGEAAAKKKGKAKQPLIAYEKQSNSIHAKL